MLGAVYVPGVLSALQGDMAFLDAEIPSANGVLTARGLAKVYGALANGGRIDGRQFLSGGLTGGLTGKRSYSPDLNVGVAKSRRTLIEDRFAVTTIRRVLNCCACWQHSLCPCARGDRQDRGAGRGVDRPS